MDYNKIIKDVKAGRLKNIYLFFGQEQYLCENVIAMLEKTVINSSFRDLNYEYMEGASITMNRIENACETLPFMDKKRLVIIKNFVYFQGGKNSKEEEEQVKSFVQYLEKIPESTYLVFWQAQDVDKRKKIFQGIKKFGEIVTFEKLKAPELEKWIEKIIGKKDKTAQKSIIHYFIENSDYLSKNSAKTLADVENEINKIIDYIGTRREIMQEDVEKILPRRLENDIFKMVDAIGKKERDTAIKLLNDMLREGENEIKILTMISRQFRILIQCRELRDKGYSPNEIASKLSLAPFVVKKGISQSQYFRGRTLREALYYTLDTDVKIKTGKINQKLALEMLIYQYTAA